MNSYEYKTDLSRGFLKCEDDQKGAFCMANKEKQLALSQN